MNLKSFFNNLFEYNDNYNFSISNKEITEKPFNMNNNFKANVFTNINDNLEFLKSKYNINSYSNFLNSNNWNIWTNNLWRNNRNNSNKF